MPQWFAKTREMVASDLYFSLQSAGSEQALADRYNQALARLQNPNYYSGSDALQNTTTNNWKPADTQQALDGHFRGDWIYYDYPTDPLQFANVGGRFWPNVPSQRVVDKVRGGTVTAIQKALGRAQLRSLGMSDADMDILFVHELHNGVEIEGVLPLATSWNCVAPAGDDFFEVESLRGPSIVEFAIATPRPYGQPITIQHEESVERAFRAREGRGAES